MIQNLKDVEQNQKIKTKSCLLPWNNEVHASPVIPDQVPKKQGVENKISQKNSAAEKTGCREQNIIQKNSADETGRTKYHSKNFSSRKKRLSKRKYH